MLCSSVVVVVFVGKKFQSSGFEYWVARFFCQCLYCLCPALLNAAQHPPLYSSIAAVEMRQPVQVKEEKGDNDSVF